MGHRYHRYGYEYLLINCRLRGAYSLTLIHSNSFGTSLSLQMNDNYKGTASAVLFLFMYVLCKKRILEYPRGV